jgi:hypothetical protein
VLGAGEIHELTRNAFAQNAYCSCGEPIRACGFWSIVAREWTAQENESFFDEYKALQHRFESLPSIAGAPLSGAKFDRFAARTEALFRIVSSTSGKRVIVDSSKLPGRAAALARMKSIDLYVVHLVRDGRGVAWSLMKAYKPDVKAGLQREIKPKSVWRTGLRWAMLNLGAEKLEEVVGSDRYLRLRYEDLAGDPAAALDRIGKMIGVDLAGIGANLSRGIAAKPVHQIAGNRLRMSAMVKVSKDEAWRSEMPDTSKRAFARLCGRLLSRYGYER